MAGRLPVGDPAQREPPALHGSGQKPARFVSSTNAPPVINLYDDIDFVFGTARDFPNRFNGDPDYFAPKGEQKGLLLDTNFVADAVNLPLIEAKERGAGGGHIRFAMAKGSMNSHISQFPTATYKKRHRHGPGAHVIILSGEGYSLMWPEDEEPRRGHRDVLDVPQLPDDRLRARVLTRLGQLFAVAHDQLHRRRIGGRGHGLRPARAGLERRLPVGFVAGLELVDPRPVHAIAAGHLAGGLVLDEQGGRNQADLHMREHPEASAVSYDLRHVSPMS